MRGSNSMFIQQRFGLESPVKKNPKLNQSSYQLSMNSFSLARNALHSEKKTKSREKRVVKRVFLDENGKEEGVQPIIEQRIEEELKSKSEADSPPKDLKSQ